MGLLRDYTAQLPVGKEMKTESAPPDRGEAVEAKPVTETSRGSRCDACRYPCDGSRDDRSYQCLRCSCFYWVVCLKYDKLKPDRNPYHENLFGLHLKFLEARILV